MTRRVSWTSMELLVASKLAHSKFHGFPWNSMELHASSKLAHSNFHGIPWNSMELLVSAKLAHFKFHGIPWNCTRHRNWRTPISTEFHGIPWNCSCQRNWRTLSSMEFHGTARVIEIGPFEVPWNSCSCQRNWSTPSSMEFHGPTPVSVIGALQVLKFVLNLGRIPWNLSFLIWMKIIFNFAEWINFRKLISTLYLFVSFFSQLICCFQYLHYTICISGITHYVSKYHSKSLFNANWNLFLSKSSMEQHLNNTCGSMEFHGT